MPADSHVAWATGQAPCEFLCTPLSRRSAQRLMTMHMPIDSVQSAEHARQYDLVEPTRCTPLIASDPHQRYHQRKRAADTKPSLYLQAPRRIVPQYTDAV